MSILCPFTSAALSVLLASQAGGTHASADACAQDPPAVVWCHEGPVSLSFLDLARQAAPILWFSPDEPLIEPVHDPEADVLTPLQVSSPEVQRYVERTAVNKHVLAAIPCDARPPDIEAPRCRQHGAVMAPTVYYQVLRVSGRREGLHVQDGAIHLDAAAGAGSLGSISLRYYFYYPLDYGSNWHTHDLESVELTIRIERAVLAGGAGHGPRKVYKARLLRVVGAAHGSDHKANVLALDPDGIQANEQRRDEVRVPLTILVEEGKHASCPDRNGDGWYTPGYDVNERVNDAWGVRDVFGVGMLESSYFSSSMTKQRRDFDQVCEGPDEACRRHFRFAPPLDPGDRARRLYSGHVAWPECAYSLRSAHILRPCPLPDDPETQRERKDAEFLRSRMRANGFGRLDPDAHRSRWKALEHLSFGAQFDRDFGWTIGGYAPFKLPVVNLQGWLNPRIAFVTRERPLRSADLVLTPSVSRYVDWYTALGGSFEGTGRGLSLEGGLQVRFDVWRVPLGVRLGLRSHLQNLETTEVGRNKGLFTAERLVFELGAGPW